MTRRWRRGPDGAPSAPAGAPAQATGAAGGRRVTLTVVDQFVSSTSNFVTGVAVARLSGPAEFGRYMLVFLIWLVAVGIHRALVTDSVIVTSHDEDDRPAVMARGLGAELVLGTAASALVAGVGLLLLLAGGRLGLVMLVLAPWLTSLLVQDYWRGMAFLQRRPGLALANDTLFAVVQLSAIGVFSVLGWRSASHMIVAWGAGATAGALLGFRLFRGIGRPRDGRAFLAGTWPLSRWMLADFLTSFASHQASLAFAALLLSQVAYGGYRAAWNLMGPTIVILHAGANFGLPEATRRANSDVHTAHTALRRFARNMSAGTFLLVAAYGAVVTVGGGRLLGAVFGPEFAPFSDLAMLAALQYLIAATWFGQVIALKALGRMRRLWSARLAVAGASLVLVVVFHRWFGTIGVGWAGVTTEVVYAFAMHAIYRAELRTPPEPEGAPEASPAPDGAVEQLPGG